MKILHLGKYAPPFFGGIENFMMDLGEAGVNDGHEVAAIVHHHQFGGQFEREVINGMTIYRVPTYGKLMFAPVSPAFGVYLNKVIDQFKPDILHLHLPNTSAFFALAFSRAKTLPWVVHWHSDVLGDNSPWFLKVFYPAYRVFESAVLKRASAVIATSTPYLASSQPLQRFKAKCEVISLGIKAPSGSHNKALQIPPSEARPLQLLMVGRLTYYKGHKDLIAALALLKQRGVNHIQLNIVGTGEQQAAIERQIRQLDLAAQITLLGKVSFAALQQQLQSADCLCLPSIERTEAFGVVLMEAAAYGLPAIVTDVPGSGMSWVVRHQQTGLVVKRNDAQSLAQAIEGLCTEPQQLGRYGSAALVRFEQHFQISAIAEQTQLLYQKVLNQKVLNQHV